MLKNTSLESRMRLDDSTWAELEKLLPKFQRGRPSKKNRNFIEAVLFRLRTGIQWRDLNGEFGPWKSVYNRFNRWSKKGYFDEIFNAVKKISQTC